MVYNRKPYEQMDDLGVPLFLETPILTFTVYSVYPYGLTPKSCFHLDTFFEFSAYQPGLLVVAILHDFHPVTLSSKSVTLTAVGVVCVILEERA